MIVDFSKGVSYLINATMGRWDNKILKYPNQDIQEISRNGYSDYEDLVIYEKPRLQNMVIMVETEARWCSCRWLHRCRAWMSHQLGSYGTAGALSMLQGQMHNRYEKGMPDDECRVCRRRKTPYNLIPGARTACQYRSVQSCSWDQEA
jgi:hypothetical protein